MNDAKRNDGDRLLDYHRGELPEEERRALEAELAASPQLRERLELERRLDAGLRERLARQRTPAPPGLETRIRESLRGGAAAGVGRRPALPWWRRPAFAAAAAVALLAAFVWVSRDEWTGGRRGGGAPAVRAVLEQSVLVVDQVCDEAGLPLEHQRSCPDPRHLNALKLADGRYWQIALHDERARRLVVDREMRGHRLLVAGELHGTIETLEIRDLTDLGLEMQTARRVIP